MSMQTFNFKVISESSGRTDLNVARVRFGDGYSQTSGRGINPVQKKWNIVFLGNAEECEAVMDFLEDHAGKMFYWKPALRPLAAFTCDAFNLDELGGGQFKVRAEFEETAVP